MVRFNMTKKEWLIFSINLLLVFNIAWSIYSIEKEFMDKAESELQEHKTDLNIYLPNTPQTIDYTKTDAALLREMYWGLINIMTSLIVILKIDYSIRINGVDK